MNTRTNPTCAKCEKATNCLNGRYCHELKRYVEYATQPICKPNKQ